MVACGIPIEQMDTKLMVNFLITTSVIAFFVFCFISILVFNLLFQIFNLIKLRNAVAIKKNRFCVLKRKIKNSCVENKKFKVKISIPLCRKI